MIDIDRSGNRAVGFKMTKALNPADVAEWQSLCQELAHELMAHVVKFLVTAEISSPDGPRPLAVAQFSAFLIEVDGKDFVVTAGHNIPDIERAVKEHAHVEYAISDGLGSEGRGIYDLIPIMLHPDDIQWTWDADRGLDFALIPLRELHSCSIRAGKSKIIPQTQIDYPRCDKVHCLIGFPEQYVSVKQRDDGATVMVQAEAQLACVILKHEPSPPSELKKEMPRFYATISHTPDEHADLDIVGMSGGPIFEVDFLQNDSGDKQIRYRLVAMQSGWSESKRTVAASFVRPYIDHLQAKLNSD